MEATLTATRRENVVRGFFWVLLATVSLITAFFVITGGPVKPNDKSHGTADVQQQITQYQAVLASNPNDLQALISLGDLYLNTSNVREAYPIFLQANEVDPNNAHVLNDLASIYQQIGRYDEALASYEKAYRLAPSHGSTLLNLAMLYSRHKQDYQKALELLTTLLASNPDPQLVMSATQEKGRIEKLLAENQ